MSPKEELIQAIHQSPDEVVEHLLLTLTALRQKPLVKAAEPNLSKTVLERMGGEPKHMLSVGGLSDRDRRRALISLALVAISERLNLPKIATLDKDFDIYRRYRKEAFERVFYPE
ncbi:MAG: hypothetical protein WBA76_19025 [Phormidesmis sp.]